MSQDENTDVQDTALLAWIEAARAGSEGREAGDAAMAEAYGRGEPMDAIAARFGVSRSTVYAARARNPDAWPRRPARPLDTPAPGPETLAWALVQQPEWSEAELGALAVQLRVDVEVLRRRAAELASGWTCRLASVPCDVCGKPLLMRLPLGKRRRHPTCRPSSAPARRQARARQGIPGTWWTPEQDAYLIAHQTEPADRLAGALSRTVDAVNSRIHVLASRGLVDARARRVALGEARRSQRH